MGAFDPRPNCHSERSRGILKPWVPASRWTRLNPPPQLSFRAQSKNLRTLGASRPMGAFEPPAPTVISSEAEESQIPAYHLGHATAHTPHIHPSFPCRRESKIPLPPRSYPPTYHSPQHHKPAAWPETSPSVRPEGNRRGNGRAGDLWAAPPLSVEMLSLPNICCGPISLEQEH